MKSKPLWTWSLMLLAGVTACSGPIATRSGIEGPPVAPASAIALAPVPEGAGPATISAHEAVAQALDRRGYRLVPDAPLRIEVGLAERGAQTDVRALGGAALSSAKTKRLLQDCEDRTHRLTLAVIAPAIPGVTRAWAEEHHCKGTLAASLPALADQAVAALAVAAPDRTTERQGKD